VVYSHGGPITVEMLGLPGRGQRRLRPAGARNDDLPSLIRQLIRVGIQTHADEGLLHERLVGGVERELIEQVLEMCDHVQVKAAAKLGINRNTLHKKVSEFSPVGPNEKN
jgi:DNA-binding NtrC family response regulator